jgi:enoyl-CoA hydratase
MSKVLLVERAGGIATLTMNRPEVLNALSSELRRELVRAFGDLSNDDSVGVLILTGAGRAFCSGLDLRELSGESGTPPEPGEIDGGAGDVVSAMRRCSKPILGAVNGPAITGGFEIALACDLVVASRNARFADTHARVGLLPGWGLSQELSRRIGIHRAKELALTGNFLSAERAEAWGLVNRVVEPEELLPTCRALAADMLSCDRATLSAYKQLIDRGFALPFGDALEFERRSHREHARGFDRRALAGRRKAIQERGRRQG